MKKFILYAFKESEIGSFVMLSELEEQASFDNNKEYHRLSFLISNDFKQKLYFYQDNQQISESLFDTLYVEDIPLHLRLLKMMNPSSMYLNIVEFCAGELYCNVELTNGDKKIVLPCSFTELLEINLFFTCAISVSNSVLNKTSEIYLNNMRLNKKSNLETTTHVNKLQKLEKKLKDAIDSDDYELASKISIEIDKIINS